MKLFDNHTHTNIEPLNKEFNELSKQFINNGIGINIVGVDIESSILAIEQSKTHKDFICSVGIHPCNILDNSLLEKTINELEQLYLLNKDKVKCIGECGLDMYHDDSRIHDQVEWFKKHIELAIKHNLALMVHVRDANYLMITTLKQYLPFKIPIIIHCYNGNLELGQIYQNMGCYLSIPGVVTYKNAKDLQEAVKSLNLDLLLTETDAPYLSPVPNRGKINNSNNLVYTNQFIADLLGMDVELFNEKMIQNVSKLFFIK